MKLPIRATRAERGMAVPLVMILLWVPAMATIALRIMGDTGAWPLWIPMVMLSALLIIITVGVYRRNRTALTSAAWAYAFGWASVIQLFFGFFILVTGRLPSKYSSHAVSRSSAIFNFLCAAAWAVVALFLSRWNERTRRDL